MHKINKFFSLPIAHRGLHNPATGVVENSRQAFERAIQGGYAIETDLQLSGDGVPMVFHDATLDRLTDHSGKVSQLSAGQLQHIKLKESKDDATILRLSELLELTPQKTPLVIELKHQDSGQDQNNENANDELAKATCQAAEAIDKPIAFKSFDPNLLKSLRKHGFAGPLGIVTEAFKDDLAKEVLTFWQRMALRHLAHYPKTKFDFISCKHTDLNLPAVQIARKFGMKVMTWTVTSEPIERAARKRADQIVFEGYLPTIGQ